MKAVPIGPHMYSLQQPYDHKHTVCWSAHTHALHMCFRTLAALFLQVPLLSPLILHMSSNPFKPTLISKCVLYFDTLKWLSRLLSPPPPSLSPPPSSFLYLFLFCCCCCLGFGLFSFYPFLPREQMRHTHCDF